MEVSPLLPFGVVASPGCSSFPPPPPPPPCIAAFHIPPPKPTPARMACGEAKIIPSNCAMKFFTREASSSCSIKECPAPPPAPPSSVVAFHSPPLPLHFRLGDAPAIPGRLALAPLRLSTLEQLLDALKPLSSSSSAPLTTSSIASDKSPRNTCPRPSRSK